MKICLEANGKFGEGYQVRVEMEEIGGGTRSVVADWSPFTVYEATRVAGKMLQRINDETGAACKLEDVLSVAGDALELNAKRDIASAKMLQKVRNGERTAFKGCDSGV